jgi:diacylglycerol O-acyltransferase
MVERMSALDAEFLHAEDGVNHLHIASCAVFEGPSLTDDEGEALMRDALPRIPRYRQRVQDVPFGIGRPVWVDDPDFDLSHHLCGVRLSPPGDHGQLAELMADLMSTELARDRPLWEAWMVDGLEDGRWALISKVHHCMVDGIAGTGLMEQVLSTEPGGRPTETEDGWDPQPPPSDTRLALDAVGEAIGLVPRVARDVVGLARDPGRTLRQAQDLGQGLWSLRREFQPAPPTSIDGPIGAQRRWATASASLDDVRTVRKKLGGTVNDVVLAAVSGGFRDLLLARDENPDEAELRTLVPVSARVDLDAVDNEVTGIVAELPIHEPDPVARLEAVRAEIDRLKASHEIELGVAMTSLVDLAPPPLMAWGTRAVVRLLRNATQHNVATVTTNVPGPQYPLYAGGRRMLDYYPFVPIALGIRVAVAILSYDGRLYFGVTGDHDTAPDVGVLADGIDAGMAELVTAAGSVA